MPIEKTAAETVVPTLPKETPSVPTEDTPADTVQAIPDMMPDNTALGSSEASPAAVPILQAETGRERSLEETAPPHVDHTAPAAKQVLTERQVQEAVQDARHSLRGTVIQK